IDGFKTYEEYMDDLIYNWNKDVPWVHERPWTDNGVWKEPNPVKHHLIGWKRWHSFDNTNRNSEESENVMENEEEERSEVFDDHKRPVCTIRRFEMIKYSFKDEEEYVAIKENEYEDLTSTSKDACRAYQEIFRMMDEGWMLTRTK
ncbi:hypothetical protein Tco_1308428, partial [Tanacetum coccineum]